MYYIVVDLMSDSTNSSNTFQTEEAGEAMARYATECSIRAKQVARDVQAVVTVTLIHKDKNLRRMSITLTTKE